MRFLFIIFGIFSTFSLSSQSHTLRIGLSYHHNEDNFYLPDFAKANNISVIEGGKLKLAFGLGYEYAFTNRNSWFLSARSDLALRTYSTIFKIGEGFEPGYKYKGPYIDLLLGGGKKFLIKNKFNAAFSLLGGIGIPLLERTESNGGPIRPSSYNLYNYLPFIEANGMFEYYYSNRRNHRWSVGISPFIRIYFKPLHEVNEFVRNDPPYFGGGFSLTVGYLNR